MYTTLISAPTLHVHLHNPDWLICDCRFNLADTNYGRRAYQVGHIPNAHYLHLDEDLSSVITAQTGRHPLPDSQQLSAKLQAIGLNSNMQVVVYDDNNGSMAARLWWLLRWLGHDAVAVLDGGLAAWQAAGYALSTQAPTVTQQGQFQARLKPEYVIKLDELTKPNVWQLVDARAAERFRGEVEPIDPIAGHIPGALNRPLTENLDGNQFKSTQQLKAEWQALLSNIPVANIVHMCGSGVTACHNLLAMEVAGLTGTKLYTGSWSEWIREPSRPIATGG
jgi:thiosulfate/3-mercaptopyruvate sulfurtransferase